jgi:hypothetical protein
MEDGMRTESSSASKTTEIDIDQATQRIIKSSNHHHLINSSISITTSITTTRPTFHKCHDTRLTSLHYLSSQSPSTSPHFKHDQHSTTTNLAGDTTHIDVLFRPPRQLSGVPVEGQGHSTDAMRPIGVPDDVPQMRIT